MLDYVNSIQHFAQLFKQTGARERLRLYNKKRLSTGIAAIVIAALFFWLSQDDLHDALRWKHGLAQVLFGVALFQLWSITTPTVESYDVIEKDKLPLMM
jgi:hypothetical protein